MTPFELKKTKKQITSICTSVKPRNGDWIRRTSDGGLCVALKTSVALTASSGKEIITHCYGSFSMTYVELEKSKRTMPSLKAYMVSSARNALGIYLLSLFSGQRVGIKGVPGYFKFIAIKRGKR